jgi:hypothetical protein
VGYSHKQKDEVENGIESSKMLLIVHRKVRLRLQTGGIIHMPPIRAVMAVSES